MALVNGVELIEIANLFLDGSIDESSWYRVENIPSGSVSFISGNYIYTNVYAEGMTDVAFTLSEFGDPDVFNFKAFEISQEVYGYFFNSLFDQSTNKITVLSEKKRANLAIRLTTKPVKGTKRIFTYPNTECIVGYSESFTKDNLVQLSVASYVYPYIADGGVEALYKIREVKADGSSLEDLYDIIDYLGNNLTYNGENIQIRL